MQLEPNPSGLCMCGCLEPTRLARQSSSSNGDVRGRPVRFLPGHNRWTSPVEYVVDDVTGCWNWMRSVHKSTGYGMAKDGRRSVYAHRMVYERSVGQIPAGLQLDHLCRNRRCVNPEHLQPVTQTENVRRGKRVRLTAEQVQLIRAGDRDDAAWASELGVSEGHVRNVRNGSKWKTL